MSFRLWPPVERPPESPRVFFLTDLPAGFQLEELHAEHRQEDPQGAKDCFEDAAFRLLSGSQLVSS